MNHFGINQGGADHGRDQTFMSAVVGVMKSIEANGVTSNPNAGKAVLRQEGFKDSAGDAIRASVSSASAGLADQIVAALDFSAAGNSTPGNVDKTLKLRSESNKSRALAAAQIGYAMAVGHEAHADRTIGRPSLGQDSFLVSGSAGTSRLGLRQEAFRNIDIRRTVAFTMGFNAAMTRQTDVVMAWFPPIFANPDQVGIEICLNLQVVFNGAYHDISGSKTEFLRRNVVRAFADPTVLNRHETQIIPVSRPENADKFVDPAVMPHVEKTFGNRKVVTAPLLFDTDINLIGISQTDALLKTGQGDHRDVIEPGIKLAAITLKSGDDIITLPTAGLKGAVFAGAQQHDQQEMNLTMRTNIAVGKLLTRYDGAALTGPLAVLATNDLRLKLGLIVNGNVNVETGNARIQKPAMTVIALVDSATQEEITSGAVFTAVKAAVAAFEFIGFDQRSFRTNANRRQVGDRINTRRFNFHFPLVYRDPITAERPAHLQEEQDAQDLTNLQSLTRIRIENEAIDTILQTAETAEAYVDMRDCDAEATDMVGLAQFFLKHAFHKETLNMVDYVDSLKSSDRAKDIQAAFVTKLRDVAARLYTTSEFKAGTDWYSGGTMPAPQVNVLTDPIIARYIMEPGELRTLGDFEMVLTSTLNYRVRGQILMSFRVAGQEASNEPNIFNFGHLMTSPELVLAANMNRNGSYFAETQVMPRYELVVLNPIMAQFTVTGIPEVLSKVPLHANFTNPIRVDGVVETHPNP